MFVLLTFLMIPAMATADNIGYTVEQYEEGLLSKDAMSLAIQNMYILGLGRGYSWANNEKEKLFCPPESLDLNQENYVSILNRTIEVIKKHPYDYEKETKKWPIELLLLLGLKETFPCKNSQRK